MTFPLRFEINAYLFDKASLYIYIYIYIHIASILYVDFMLYMYVLMCVYIEISR